MSLYLFFAFVCGILFNVFWGYVLGLGYGIRVFQNTMADCILMMAKNVQSVYEINQLKYMALDIMDRDEKYIEFQKKIDEREATSLKNTVIRNLINSVPSRFNSVLQFHDWDSAMGYLDEIYKGETK